jgi:hypothetical protein
VFPRWAGHVERKGVKSEEETRLGGRLYIILFQATSPQLPRNSPKTATRHRYTTTRPPKNKDIK